MEMVNVQDVTRQAAAQLSGVTWTLSDGTTTTTDITALDSFDVVDVGKAVVDPSTGEVIRGTAETFLQAAISLIARMEVESRAYTGDLRDFMVKDSEWGGFLERIYFSLTDIIDDPKWRLMENWKNGKKNYAHEENGFYPIPAQAKVFQEAKGLLTPISKPTDQLKEACRSWEDMQAFLTGIEAAVRNTLELGLQSLRHMLAQDAIAVSMAGTQTAINLLSMYNNDTGNTLAAANALQDADFLTYALQVISETRDNMRTFNVAFNDGTVPTFTDEEYSKLILLNKFDKAARFKVKASTFNRDDLAVGPYTTTTSWQGYNDGGSGTVNFDFDSVSKVMIAADSNDKLGIGTSAFTATGVVGLLFDRYALGICPYKRKVTGNYVAFTDHFNEFHHVLVNMILDTKYPIVAFYIADPPKP